MKAAHELIGTTRLFCRTHSLLIAGWAAAQFAMLTLLKVIERSPGFHGLRHSLSSGLEVSMSLDFVFCIGLTWAIAGYLGMLFNRKARTGWMLQLPFPSSALIGVPEILLVLNALVIYVFLPEFWSIGSGAHGLPGSFLYLSFPFLTLYLVRNSRQPVLVFLPTILLCPVLYMLVFKFWWMNYGERQGMIWSPWTQLAFFAPIIVGAALARRGRAMASLLAATSLFAAITWLRPPFYGLGSDLCPEVLRTTQRHPGSYLYSEKEFLFCQARRD